MSTAPASRENLRPPFSLQRADLTKLLEKVPPHAVEAECALLGAMVLDWNVIGEVVQILQGPDDFYKVTHGVIYESIVHLYDTSADRRVPLDIISLYNRLKDLGQADNIGGKDYLIELVESVPSAVNAPSYARIVREKAVLRHLIDAAGRILQTAYTSAEPAGEQLDQAEQDIFRLAQTRGSADDAADLGTLLQETYSKLENHDGRLISGVETGFFELDELLNGLQAGEMVIIAARPSMGKTAFAVNIAEHVAAVNKKPIAIFSLEMSKQQLAQRLLCSHSGVDSHRLRRNMLTETDWPRLHQSVAELTEAPLYIDDTPGLTLLQLRAKARRLATRHDVKAIVIDYLQLMSAPGAESRQQEVANLSRGIKAMSRELNVPVVCLSQLNRAAESREGHRPRMSDLRESGSIEQDADVILMLHREEYYHSDPDWGRDNPDKVGIAEIIIAKQRNGPTGTVELRFDGQTTRFKNLAR